MNLLLAALGVLLGSGFLALVAWRSWRLSTLFGAGGAVVGGVLGAVPALAVLAGGEVSSLRLAWQVPYGSFFLEIDALSAWFLLTVLAVCTLAAIYGSQYLRAYADQKSLGPPWFFFNLLTASMVLVLSARNGVLFLVAWEVMSLASFFLVTFDDEKDSVRQAGWIYLVATHLGTAFLLVLFILLGRQGGSLDFDTFTAGPGPWSAGLLFLLALVGFGTKAGFLPLHVWLPEAHPAAPSHVSAVMSGVMIKTGIYGLVRTLTFLGPPPAWWGWTMIGIGLTSGILGVLFALAQHDLKRLLAYHSVENIGIIALGLGIGLVGQSSDLPAIAVLGYAGALLHVVNHALFKGLLFLGAGAVLHGTGTTDMEELGGLQKKMPVTALTFLIGAAAISGLPPLNGFASEFLIFLGAFAGSTQADSLRALPLLVGIAGLALIGGLAAACFAKAFGIVFLGLPRSHQAETAHAPGNWMRWPMIVMAAGCIFIGLFAPLVVGMLVPVIQIVSGVSGGRIAEQLGTASGLLGKISLAAGILIALVVGLTWLRWRLLRGRSVAESETWGCGYARPTARMQYTASSFAWPFTNWFRTLLRTRKQQPTLRAYFPPEEELATETPAVWQESFYRPLFLGVRAALARLRWLQHGRVQVYVLYIALTIFVLLIWYLGLGA